MSSSAAGTPPAPPCTIVLFGAGGDLVKRLLMPSLYDLAVAGLLDPATKIIGVDRAEFDDESWRAHLKESLYRLAADPTAEFNAGTIHDDVWNDLSARLSFLRGDITTDEPYSALHQRIEGNAVFYGAVAARFFEPIASGLGRAGLFQESENAFRRLIVEKPFGSDLPSAQQLDRQLLSVADESQIYRIDHFLGKEMVQSIMAVRFANRFIEPAWSGEHIDHVQITAAETIGVEARGAFYEHAGALRDMVPNHLFQLLSMTAMEPPAAMAEKPMRDAKATLLGAVSLASPLDAVRGQYAAGRLGGVDYPAYRDEPGVAPDSRIETYAALKFSVATPRWQGVPFYVRSGKRMTAHRTEILIQFKPSLHEIFRSAGPAPVSADRLVIRIDGEKGFSLQFQSKAPTPSYSLAPVEATFRHDDFFPAQPSVGYETLLHACMRGDATFFQRADSIEAAWAAVEPALESWTSGEPDLYASGSAGPEAADALLARDGHAWADLGPDPDARVGTARAGAPA